MAHEVPLLLLLLFEKILAQFENTTLSKQRRLHCGIKRRCCQPERVKEKHLNKVFRQNRPFAVCLDQAMTP